MKKIETRLTEVKILEPRIFEDARGSFFEAYRGDTLRALGIDITFVQENHSISKKGVLRGLHYQLGKPQDKLVRCVQGAVFDVAVDIRKGSKTRGQWTGVVLSASNRLQIFIPGGFAHGFLSLSPGAEVIYKVSNYYAPEEERGILWNDPSIGVRWPLDAPDPIMNTRDTGFPLLSEVSEK
jgi:dTDP-4-dehydrorhamnose 3,5-epimerase